MKYIFIVAQLNDHSYYTQLPQLC